MLSLSLSLSLSLGLTLTVIPNPNAFAPTLYSSHCGAEDAPRDVSIMSDVTMSFTFPQGEGDARWVKLNAGQVRKQLA